MNEAYEILAEEFDTVTERVNKIQQAQDSTGTASSPIAIRRAAVASDPKLQSQIELARKTNKDEIAKEDRRAVEEANRQAKVKDITANAENAGTNSLQVAAIEFAADSASYVVDAENSVAVANEVAKFDLGASAKVVTNSNLENLERDLAAASADGDKDAQASLLAVQKLRKRRELDPIAILSQQEAADFFNLTNQNDEFVNPGQVTFGQRLSLSSEIAEQSLDAPGVISNIAGAFYNGSQRKRGARFADQIIENTIPEFTSPIEGIDGPINSEIPGSTQRTVANADQIVQEASQQTNALLQQQVDLLTDLKESNNQTASNTRPKRTRRPIIDSASIIREARQ